MGGFCVFGMTTEMARKKAVRKVPARDPKTRREYSRQEYDAMLEAETARIFESAKAAQASPEFDAPQFCRDWLEVAKRTSSIRSPKVMRKGEKTDKNGNKVLNKRTGLPSIGWVPYK